MDRREEYAECEASKDQLNPVAADHRVRDNTQDTAQADAIHLRIALARVCLGKWEELTGDKPDDVARINLPRDRPQRSSLLSHLEVVESEQRLNSFIVAQGE